MAIVKMSKIKLIGMTYHREDILNALHKTGCVEVASPLSDDDTFFVPADNAEELSAVSTDAENAIDFFTEQLERSKNKKYYPKNVADLQRAFIVSYDDFFAVKNEKEKYLNLIAELKKSDETLSEIKAEKLRLYNSITALSPYAAVSEPFSAFRNTSRTDVFFGTVKQEQLNSLNDFFATTETCIWKVYTEATASVVSAICLHCDAQVVKDKLNEAGFVQCPFDYNQTAAQKIDDLQKSVLAVEKREDAIAERVCKIAPEIKGLKVFADFYRFLLEKAKDCEGFNYTASTFALEGYLPKDMTEKVRNAVLSVTDAVFIEFSEPTKEDEPPTLTSNGKLAAQAEFITDMYSVPNYREMDPNKVVFFFFMLFMGVIMADVCYGIVMLVLGVCLSSRIKIENGTKKLWNVVAIGGVFTIIFGLLFNSFLGFELLPFNVLPSPVPKTGETSDNLMVILLLCLLLGVVQMAVGYFCKAINCFMQKDFWGGLFDGLVWVTFFIGFVLATFNFLLDYLMSDEFVVNSAVREFFDTMQMPGLYIVLGSVLVAALTAGREERGFGKFSKGFGAVYGLINIMSDILSYARLFGLMLSGMIIASTFNDIGMNIAASGGIGYALGAVVMLLGHTFNIAMGVLGAYIHDSRLQYIEFFSKFYTGEGRKFTPIGSQLKYVCVQIEN